MSATPVGADRRVSLDALRGLAAWLVLLSHVGFWTGRTASGAVGGLSARGDAGVAVFFALSAFLLASPLVRRALTGTAGWSWRTYARRRLGRILPAYYLALAGVVLVAVVIGGTARAVLDGPTLLAHLVLAQGVTGRTFVSFTQTWSLTSELTFYLLLPLLAAGLRPWLDAVRSRSGAKGVSTRLLFVCAALGGAGLALQAGAAVLTGPTAPWWTGALATSAPAHALWFAVGGAVAVLVESERAGVEPGRWSEVVAVLRTSPGTLLALAGVLWLISATPLAGPRDLADPSVPAAVAKEVLYAAAALALLLAGVSACRRRDLPEPLLGAARWLGATSYGVFLWHVLVLQVVFAGLDLPLFAAPFVPVLVLVTVVSLGLAHLSWHLVERPVIERVHGSGGARGARPGAARP